ncbi:MAG: hypothetical protein P8Q14_09325 [Vicingaceae bacterium]|nr:hypothetical protein [Vicingaceae bacterium]
MDIIIKILEWGTKIASIAILALVLFIVGAHVMEGFKPGFEISNHEIKAAICLISMFLGVAIGLRWSLTGGLLTIVAIVFFMLLEQSFKLNVVFAGVLIVSCLYVGIYFLKRFNR